MSNVITPVMGIELPTPGVTGALGVEPPGQSWMELQNAATLQIDSHDHSGGGKGLPIVTSSIDIDADLDLNGFALLGVTSIGLEASTLLTSALRIFSYNGNLYYTNSSGAAVQITNGTAVAGAPGNITGMVSGVSAFWYPAGACFVFQRAANTFANFRIGSIGIGDSSVANGKRVTISAPAGLASDYAIELPGALPAARRFLTLDNGGLLTATMNVDGSTLEVSGDTFRVKDLGIVEAKIGALAVTEGKIGALAVTEGKIGALAVATAKIANKAVTYEKLADLWTVAGAIAGSSNSATPIDIGGNFGMAGVTGVRPWLIMLQSDNDAGPMNIHVTASDAVSGVVELYYNVDGGAWVRFATYAGTTLGMADVPIPVPPTVHYFPAGTIRWKVMGYVTDPAHGTMYVSNAKLYAVQL